MANSICHNSGEWLRVMRERGHTPVLDDDGSLDIFIMDYDIHNGPGCSVCGWSTCWHCNSSPITVVPRECKRED